jgi:hypothetical protein
VGARPKNVSFLCLVLVIGFASVFDTIIAASMSETIDEPDYIAYGVQVLHLRPDRSQYFFDSKTPISALNAIPRVAAAYLDGHGVPHRILAILGELRVARLASIMAALLLNFFVYQWAHDLYGSSAALASSVMVVLSPNLIAHGTLATNDGYFTLGVVASLYFFRRYLLQPTLRNACLSGFTLAFAQLTKSLAIFLYPLVCIFLVLIALSRTRSAAPLTRKSLVVYVAIAVAFFFVLTNVAYCFDRTFTALSSYHFESASFVRLQRMPVLRNALVPLPYPFLQGLDMMKYSDDMGITYGNIYLLGELRRVHEPQFHNFKSYYAVALFFKEPIALQILFFLGLIWIWQNCCREGFLAGEGLLLAAAATLMVWESLFRKSQIGIRNILPALAIDIIIAGAAFSSIASMSRTKKLALGLLMLWLCLSTLSYYPHMIPYMNEWVFDRRLSYKILADSNLDWGQNSRLVDEFLKKNPDVVLNPDSPISGRVLVGTNRLVGIYPDHKPMLWLSRYRPVAHVGYAHLLFVVPANEIATGTRGERTE